jgi:hypothetical protein
VADHADFAGLIPDVIGRFGLWPQSEPVAVPGGTLNWNFRIETDGGSYFVRRYRDNLETERIKGEHELLRWAEERGVPVALPEETPDDLSLVQRAGAGQSSPGSTATFDPEVPCRPERPRRWGRCTVTCSRCLPSTQRQTAPA